MTAKIARQLTRYPRARARLVQVFAGSTAAVLTIVLAIVSGRAPQQPHPIYAQQTLKDERPKHRSSTRQTLAATAQSRSLSHSSASSTKGLLRPAFEAGKANASSSTNWVARVN